MSTRDIHDQLNDLYGIDLSAEMVSKITDKILPQVKEWQSRPLILSRLVDTFFSRVLYSMLLLPENHSTAVV